MLLFSIYNEKITKLLRKKHFRTVASPDAWPSVINARRQYILVVIVIDFFEFQLNVIIIVIEVCVL